jgi:general secretion pathway protein K
MYNIITKLGNIFCASRRFPLPPRPREGGYALIITLFVTAILVAVIVEYAYGVYVSTARAAIFKDSQRAGLLAGNGVELAERALEDLTRRTPNMTSPPEGLVFTRTEAGMTVEIRVVDELSRISSNVVYEKTGVENGRISSSFSVLLDVLGLDPHLKVTLSDWIDADDEPRIYGAEAADHYGALADPYRPRNGYPATTDELLMVKGFSPEVYRALKDYVSPYNTGGLVNINTAPGAVIMALSEEITEDLADDVIRRREEAPFKDRSEIIKVPGFETLGFGLQDKITVESRVYRVISRATSGEITREVEAVVHVGKGGGGLLYWREG